MTQHQPDPDRRLLVAAFPMPTSTELSTAYDNLFQAVNGDAETRRRLGNPALLPRPWIPASCTERRLRAELWRWLDDVVTWLNEQYVWDPSTGMIPSCWPQHPHLVNEIAVLADQRRRAALDLTSSSLEEWHRYCLPNFVDRLQRRMRTGCDEKHTSWPAKPRHDRHHRTGRLRVDAFNDDLEALPPPDWGAGEQRMDEATLPLRLAADHGEIIDPETGETR